MKIIDISIGVNEETSTWPKVPKPRFKKICSIGADHSANDTKINMSVHTGTHIDAPLHFISNGKSIDKLSLGTFIGPAHVVHLAKVKVITEQVLEGLNLPRKTTRILFRTSNSLEWGKGHSKFNKNYVGLTTSAARWLVKHQIKLVGVDYISVAKFSEAVLVHQILLKAEVALLEGISLTNVKQGVYQLICLPVKISNCEAASTRAILVKT